MYTYHGLIGDPRNPSTPASCHLLPERSEMRLGLADSYALSVNAALNTRSRTPAYCKGPVLRVSF